MKKKMGFYIKYLKICKKIVKLQLKFKYRFIRLCNSQGKNATTPKLSILTAIKITARFFLHEEYSTKNKKFKIM